MRAGGWAVSRVEVVRAVFVGNDDMMTWCLSACAWTHVLKYCCCVVVADSMQGSRT
jgi:hypothetical protein